MLYIIIRHLSNWLRVLLAIVILSCLVKPSLLVSPGHLQLWIKYDYQATICLIEVNIYNFRVPTYSGKLREMAIPWKIGEISGNLQSSSGNFRKQKNIREFSGNLGFGRFKYCFWEMLHCFIYIYILLHLLCPQSPNQEYMSNSHYNRLTKIQSLLFSYHFIIQLKLQNELRLV